MVLTMPTFSHSPLIGLSAIGLLAVSTPNAIAQSLPVDTPYEELMESGDTQYIAGYNQGVRSLPLGRASVEAMNKKQARQAAYNGLSVSQNGHGYTVKAGAFRNFENAKRLQAKLYSIGPSRIEPRTANGMEFYGVYLGPWKTEGDAFTAYSMAIDKGMQDGTIIEE
jgi:cell division protein FtsN